MKLLSLKLLLPLLLLGCETKSSANLQVDSDLVDAAKNKVSALLYSCSVSKPEANNYQGHIVISQTSMVLKQSSDSARYALGEYQIEEDELFVNPEAEPYFECQETKPEADGYSLHIKLYEDRVVVRQRSKSAKYAPQSFAILPTAGEAKPKVEKPDAPAEEKVVPQPATAVVPLFSCTTHRPEAYNYTGTIQIFESSMEWRQQSTVGRYALGQYSLVEDMGFVPFPSEEPQFECHLSKPEADGYKLHIKLYENRVYVLQSSTSARYMPLSYAITPK